MQPLQPLGTSARDADEPLNMAGSSRCRVPGAGAVSLVTCVVAEVVSVYRVCIRCLNTAPKNYKVLELPCRLFRAAAHHTGALLRRLNMSRPDARRSVAGARRVLGHHLVPPLARLDGAEEPSLTSVCESTARAAAR